MIPRIHLIAAKVRQFLFYLKIAFPFFVKQKEIPLILGLVITDRCDLSCSHCRVANTGRRDLTMAEIVEKLNSFYRRGFRELYIEGGEPFLWKDGNLALKAIVAAARKSGFFHVHVYTNGLHKLECDADMFWISVDGTEEKHNLIRGITFNRVINTIKSAQHNKISIIYTINNVNKNNIEEFLEFVLKEKLNIAGVMFYFHTPYYGKDELFISCEERKRLFENLLDLKKRGLPVLNSYAVLKAFKNGTWKKPGETSVITDVDGDYTCCRYNFAETCGECGFTACAEITEAQRLKPSALINLTRFW